MRHPIRLLVVVVTFWALVALGLALTVRAEMPCHPCEGGVCSSDAGCAYPCVCANRAPGPGRCVR